MKAFLHSHRKAVVGFGLYYVLYTAAVIRGIQMGRSFYVLLGSGLLLLVELLVTVGGGTNHYVRSRDFQQNPSAAQDIRLSGAELPIGPGRFSVPFTLLLVAPPLLFFLVLFLLSFFLP